MASSVRDAGPCVEIPIGTSLGGKVAAPKPYIAAGDVMLSVCGLKAHSRVLTFCRRNYFFKF